MKYSGRPMEDYDDAIKKAHVWLKSQQKPDGSVERDTPLGGYYTQPMAFRAMGDPVSANRCLDLIRRQFLKEDGFLQHEKDVDDGLAYVPSWTIISSHMWDRFDISYPVSKWILQFQDPKTGGFFETFEDVKKRKGMIHFETTTVGGMALVHVGKIQSAEKVGGFLLRLHKEQPDISNRYLFVWEAGKGIVSDYDESDARRFAVTRGKQKQNYFKHGLFISLLSQLYMATGKKEYVNAAKENFEFALGCHEDIWHSGLSHKLCLGSAVLYLATGDHKYFEAAKRIGDHLISLQKEDGRYHYPEVCKNLEDQSLIVNLDIVSQFTSWIAKTRSIMRDGE